MNKKSASVLVLIALAAGMGVNELRHDKSTVHIPIHIPSTHVTAIEIKSQTVDLSQELPGRANAHKIAEIRPQVSGVITDRLFEEGSNVKKGQQLYQINPAPYQAACDSARADLLKAEAALKPIQIQEERYAKVVILDAVSKQDYDNVIADLNQAKANVSIAQAALNTAKINLDYTKVYAPISGKIGKSSITVGALVEASQASVLATITQLDPIYIDVNQTSDNLKDLYNNIPINNNNTATLFLKNQKTEYEHPGELQFSDVIVDPSTGLVPLRLLFPNPKGEILPGMFVRTKMNLSSDNAILVPQQAATRGADGELRVWKINEGNVVNPVIIKAKRTVNSSWLVSEGLKAGDKIVIEGIQKIRPGSIVSLTESSAQASLTADNRG